MKKYQFDKKEKQLSAKKKREEHEDTPGWRRLKRIVNYEHEGINGRKGPKRLTKFCMRSLKFDGTF